MTDPIRAALSQLEPEGPTDEELYKLWEADGQGDFQECRSFARDVLARWGHPHSRWTADRAQRQPVPVSERLHQMEDLAADAVAGLRYIEESHGRLYGVGWDRVYEKADRLNPAHALPLPGEVES